MKNFQLLYGVISHNYNIQSKSHVWRMFKFSFFFCVETPLHFYVRAFPILTNYMVRYIITLSYM